MRPLQALTGLCVVLVAIAAFSSPSTTVYSQFATNTPSGSPDAPTNVTAPASGGIFATNTPSGPTLTPSSSPTATATATSTATATWTPSATPSPTLTPSPTPTTIGPFKYPDGINALTGLPFVDEAAQNRRNLILKVSNYPPLVRPQTGLNQADIVYEYEVEGGVTRFAAIFRSQTPPLVGSIRSARLMDIELTTMYDAFLGYSGTSEPIQKLLLSPPFFNFQLLSPLIGDNCEEAGFCRYPDGDKPFEHTLFAETAKVWAAGARRNSILGVKAKGFAFSDIPDAGGETANDLFIDWYGQVEARWQWDAASATYLRYTDGLPHLDAADDRQLWTDNVVVIEVPHIERPDLFPEGAKYTSQEIQLWDQGRAYVLRDGVYYQGFWRRQDREPGNALQVIFGNNAPILLKPGKTYVEVVRWFGDVTVSSEFTDVGATATAVALTPTATPLDIQENDGG